MNVKECDDYISDMVVDRTKKILVATWLDAITLVAVLLRKKN